MVAAISSEPFQIIYRNAVKQLPARKDGYTRFVLLSDTHAHIFPVPDGDILIHAGDLTERGTTAELQKTTDWLCSLPHSSKIIIAGNHDYCLDRDTTGSDQLYSSSMQILQSAKAKAARLIYLMDELCEIQIREGGKKWKIWGSPWSAAFCSMAFNVPRGEASAEIYACIPDDTDILISHGPPYGILDKIVRGRHVGCDKLLVRSKEIQPRMHVWGHIHEDRGVKIEDASPERPVGTVFVNAANAGTFHRPRLWGIDVYQPIVIDMKDQVP